MSELIMMTAIICVTVAFCVFVLCAVWSSKIKNKTVQIKGLSSILDGDHDFIDREEFEEYEDIVKNKFDIIDMHIKDLESSSEEYKKDMLNAMKDGDWARITDLVQKNKEKK